MSATIISHPRRADGAFAMADDPMHPYFHDGLRALVRLANDPRVLELHRRRAARHLETIRALPRTGAYVPPPESAS